MAVTMLTVPALFGQSHKTIVVNPQASQIEVITPTPSPTPIPIACQCVAYVKKVTGVPYNGNAIDWQKYINQSTPSRGAIIVMNASKRGHLGQVIDYDSLTVTFRSQNWSGPCVVENTTIPINDLRILGYITY